jgi:acetylornithine deacetylase
VTFSLEPTELAPCAAEGGLVHFRIEVEGVEAHASTRYLSVHAGGKRAGGVNAIEKTIKLIAALQELEREWANTKSHPILPRGYDTLLPGIIVGGPGGGRDGRLNIFSNAGTTPNYCSVEYNLWFYPDESFEDVRAEVEEYVRLVAQTDPWLREHPPQIEWLVDADCGETPADHELVRMCRESLADLGCPPVVQGICSHTDMGWFVNSGIPTINFGPGEPRVAHQNDESIRVADLLDATRMIAVSILRWCGVVEGS